PFLDILFGSAIAGSSQRGSSLNRYSIRRTWSIRTWFLCVETKIERHDYLTKCEVRKDLEIIKNLLIKLNEETRSTEIDGFKLQLKYRRALIGIARIELFLCGVLNKSKDDICEEHKNWMMEKNIHLMNEDEILASIWQLERSESGFVFVLQERGAKEVYCVVDSSKYFPNGLAADPGERRVKKEFKQ
ncbi:hypothetical protein MKW98_004488, partial [Papaver atlanticum]